MSAFCICCGMWQSYITVCQTRRNPENRCPAAMSRRSRNSRAWRHVWSGIRRDADSRVLVLASESQEWGYERLQYSDSDSEPDYRLMVPPVPSAVPVTGESYCTCNSQAEPSYNPRLRGFHRVKDCHCGEEDQDFDWVWDDSNRSTATLMTCDNRKVNFHTEYSCGTAAIRGSKELADGQHFWEIKMTSPVYGTDMMVGIGTCDVNLDKYRHTFCSLLGKDDDSWGLSYTGLLHHEGDKVNFSSRFGQGSIIGVHLDTWHGTLTFFKNRKCIGNYRGHRRCGYGATEQAFLPHGVFHSSQEQHEDDPLLLHTHFPAVPVLCPPPPAPP
ncbi:SPRY domain-containing SOCS box protein 3-like isoform 3-T7 [Salvelinus alpinus]|uniref:SPRY domain-containing SOCS box protein 3a isoform X3 n=1 Tax=Salvelinus alpinus TaxID=8036 RepID=UPI0039FBA91E